MGWGCTGDAPNIMAGAARRAKNLIHVIKKYIYNTSLTRNKNQTPSLCRACLLRVYLLRCTDTKRTRRAADAWDLSDLQHPQHPTQAPALFFSGTRPVSPWLPSAVCQLSSDSAEWAGLLLVLVQAR